MADTSVKLSGTYDSIEAYNILEEMRNMSSDYEEIRTEAAAAASAATAASTAATNAVNTANAAVANAQTYAGNANTSAGEAAGYASDASTAATNAASSETNASNSATAAATSAANAAASEAVVAGALPLTGGTITGNLEVAGALTKGGNNVATSNWKIENVTLSLSGASIKSWGFCYIAYNENVAILSISGLVVGRTISQDTVLCYLPVSSLMKAYAPVHDMSNGSTVSHAVVTGNYVNLNAISNAADSHAFFVVFPIA